MTQPLSNAAWDIGRAGPLCAACGRRLDAGQTCWAALVEGRPPAEGPAPDAASAAPPAPSVGPPASRYARIDFCEPCWHAGRRPTDSGGGTLFCFWKTSPPVPQQKKRLLVDDSVLVDLFARLEDRTAAADVHFRFVLALILMRKRLLRYESTEPAATPALPLSAAPPAAPGAAPEVWIMTPRGGAAPVKVTNPQLTPEQIADVSLQLTQILAEEI
jgi:hypothetical protein